MKKTKENEKMAEPGRLRVHVCIDQELGHVKATGLARTWLGLLEAARVHADLDLTVHAPAPMARVQSLAANVRVCEHRVRYRVARWLERRGVTSPTPWLVGPWIGTLGRELAGADVIQTTSTHQALSLTGLVAATRRRIPLVTALQTDAAAYAAHDARALARHLFRLRGRLRVDPEACARAAHRAMERQIEWYLRRCALVFVSAPAQTRHVSLAGPAARAAYLPRGIDCRTFAPIHRDRDWLAHRYGIARDMPVVLYVGRIGPEKSPLRLAGALGRLAAEGERFTLIVCGNGPERAALADLLPGRVVFAGYQPHETLRRIYASADVFAFPSETECFAGVVVEAMASALPVVVSGRGGAGQHVSRPGEDGVIVAESTDAAWAAAIGALLRDPGRRLRLGQQARQRVLDRYPTWGAVMAEVVKPSWIAAAATRDAQPAWRPLPRGWTAPHRALSRA